MPETLVPDTSVLIDGRITHLVESDFPGADVLVPNAALAELEAQANRGLETGFTGLDELQKLQHWAKEGKVTVSFVGERPRPEEIERAEMGAMDALIRQTAVENDGIFVTSDRVQAHSAAAQGLRHHYIRPIVDEEPDLTDLAVWRFFEDEGEGDIMSVHLKADCIPMVKRGKPGRLDYEPASGAAGQREMPHQEIRNIIRECIEFAKRDYQSFVELDRQGCTVVQLGPMRIVLAQPPFSDGLEITAVRPIFKAKIEDYELPEKILDRIEEKSRGVFIAGPPGSGKSTFAAAVAEWLHGKDRVVKTMEQPRDLQVPKELTQYGALDRDMAWTGEVMLLVRPDHVVYDEVRTTSDFKTYADMRLAGVGLFGVTHANRAIDAVQRLIGRVDLGMIPQIVDTVIFIDAGRIAQILELEFTVKVPHGMTQEDLARPVVLVRDVLEGTELYELYSYGEQIVVMPLVEMEQKTSAQSALAQKELERILRRRLHGHFEIDLKGNRATVYAEEWEVPKLIGSGGRTIKNLERQAGIRIDVKSLVDRPSPKARGGPAEMVPVLRKTKKNLFLQTGPEFGGRICQVYVGDGLVGELVASGQGKLRFKLGSPEAKVLLDAKKEGLTVTVRAQ